jgi:hypothetical protein
MPVRIGEFTGAQTRVDALQFSRTVAPRNGLVGRAAAF